MVLREPFELDRAVRCRLMFKRGTTTYIGSHLEHLQPARVPGQ
jgi:hypothetical protein